MLVPADAFGPTATYIVTGMLAQSLAGVVYTLDVVKERRRRRSTWPGADYKAPSTPRWRRGGLFVSVGDNLVPANQSALCSSAWKWV